jgi:cobyric acid synthase
VQKQNDLIIVVLSLLQIGFISCYTVIKPFPVSDREQNNRNAFQRELIVDNNLIATWINKQLLMDYGYKVRTVIFTSKGKVYFNVNRNVSGNNFEVGDYRIFGDSLIVYFDNKYFLEKYLYKIENNRLHLESMREDKNELYTMVEDNSFSYQRETD